MPLTVPNRKQYLLIDNRCRRYSAPDSLRYGVPSSCSATCLSEESEDDSRRSKVSIIDLSVLFESDSDSSLEFDTSVSKDVSPAPPSFRPVALPIGCYDCVRQDEESVIHTHAAALFCRWPVWRTVILAQVLSMCLAIQDYSLDAMLTAEHSLPINSQNLPTYLLLSIIWTTQLAKRENGRSIGKVFHLSGLRYILLAVLHVEVNNLVTSSLKHESYTGNQMIDCVAASLAFIVAYVCLDIEFEITHTLGFALSFTGSIGMCAAVMNQSSADDDITWGDVLRFGSGLFICFNSLAQELIVKSIDTVEYLGMIGIIGSLICAIQIIILERAAVWPEDCKYWCPQAVFSLAQVIFFCLAPKILRDVGATGLHLGLMSSEFYSAVLYCLFKGILTKTLMAISWLFVIFGSYIFTIKRTYIQKNYFFPVQVTIRRQDS